MHKAYLLSLLVCLSLNSYSQKLYVWCPKTQEIKPRSGFLAKDTIDLVIFDGRVLTKNSRIECNSADVMAAIASNIQKAYPAALLQIQGDSAYYRDPAPGRITLKLGVSAFHAGFGVDISVGIGSIGGSFSYGIIPKGKWNAITAYYLRLYDYRNGKTEKLTTSISKIASRPNMWGYRSAQDCLNETYMAANQDLLFFIDGG